MANKEFLEKLAETEAKFEKINYDTLIRKGLGDESLEKELEPRLIDLRKIIAFVHKYAPFVHNEPVESTRTQLDHIAQIMDQQANIGNPEYISKKDEFLRTFDSNLETI